MPLGIDQTVEHFKAHAPAGTAAAGLRLAVLFGHRLDHQTRADLPVLGVQPFAGGDQDVVIEGKKASGDLTDRGIVIPGREVSFLQDRDLSFVRDRGGDDPDGMDVAEEPFREGDFDFRLPLAQSGGRGGSAAEKAFFAQVHRGGGDAPKAFEDADARAGDDGVGDGVDFVGHHVDGVVQCVFHKELGVVGAGGGGACQHALADFALDHDGKDSFPVPRRRRGRYVRDDAAGRGASQLSRAPGSVRS